MKRNNVRRVCQVALWAVLGMAMLSTVRVATATPATQQEDQSAPRTVSSQELSQWYLREGAGDSRSLSSEDYRIGPEDLLQISVFQVEDFNRVARVSADGLIYLPLLGQIQAAGLTPHELGQAISRLLSEKYVQDPQVSVLVQEYHGEPVTVIGAVKAPGVYQLKARKTLVHVLSLAGGLADDAGNEIWVSHGFSPLLMQAAAQKLETGQDVPANSTTVKISELLGPNGAQWDIPVRGGDVIRIPKAQMVYAMGEVQAPGGYVLEHDNQRISVMQLVALAKGTTRKAAAGNARIIQTNFKGEREEKEIDLGKLFEGKVADIELSPNDILYVPPSKVKGALLRGLESAIQIGTGILIYRPL